MKKVFSRWIHSLASATTSDASSGKNKSKREKNSSAPKSKKLTLEALEDRNLLSAAGITFEQLPDFTYQPSKDSADISFGLERSHFLSAASMASSKGNDIVSVDRDSLTVTTFLNNNGLYTTSKTTVLSGIGTNSDKLKRFAVADMDNDGIDDLLVLYAKSERYPQGGTTVYRSDLVIDVYKGARDGSFSTSSVTTQISDPFKFTASDSDFMFLNVQVRNVTGSAHPDLLVTLRGTTRQESGTENVDVDKSFFFVGKNNGFETTAVAIPSSVTGNATAFANFTTTSTSWQLISELDSSPTDISRRIQTLNFYNTTVTSSSISSTAAGKREYSAASPLWTTTANVIGNAADEIISGIQYINASSELKNAVRVSQITSSLPTGSTEVPMSISTYNTDIEARYYAVSDFNNDGYKDILISDGTSYQFLVGTSTGQFKTQSKIDSFANYLATTVGDFDHDGYQDVLAIGEKQLMLLPGNPASPYYSSGQVLLNFSAKANDAAFGNFNGDGYMDFVISHVDAGTTLTVYCGTGPEDNALFKRFAMISGDAYKPSALVVGNFVTKKVPGASNPKDDFAVLYASGTTILTYSLDGNTVKEAQKTTLPTAVMDIAAGDFNNDGYDDIITINETVENVTILKNKGNGTFDLNAETIKVGTSTSSDQFFAGCVATADINGDGWLDFAVLSVGRSEVSFYTQNVKDGKGTGTFSANAATANIGNLNLKKAARSFDMIFEDFDRDGRIDLLVGVTGTNNAMVFQNKGTKAGEFSTERNWVQDDTLKLDGAFVGFATGFKTGTNYASKTPGVVIVSGNNIYRFENTTVSETSPGIMEIVFREYNPQNPIDLNSAQHEKVPEFLPENQKVSGPKLTWLHEWGCYYMEVWGSTGSTSEEISSFTTTINYDRTLFSPIYVSGNPRIETTNNFTLDSKSVADGKITVTGTSTSASLGRNKFVLLFRVYVMPAQNTAPKGQKENVGVAITDAGYAIPVSSGFRFDYGTAQLNGKNLVNLIDGELLPVYPVIFDLNDDGTIVGSDYTAFTNPAQAWGKTVDSENSVIAKWDFNHTGKVDESDWTLFTRPGTLGVSRPVYKDGVLQPFLHDRFPAGFGQAPWPQLKTASPDILESSADILDTVFIYENDTESEFRSQDTATVDAGITVSSTLNFFADDAVYRTDLTLDNALQISELDTLGYVARADSSFDAEAKRVKLFDQILGEFYADEDEDGLLLKEISDVYEYPLDSFQLNDKILAELV